MRVLVMRYVEYPRPGTPHTFAVSALDTPQLLPHDVRDHIVAIGAGRLVPLDHGQKDGGIAALIARKRTNWR